MTFMAINVVNAKPKPKSEFRFSDLSPSVQREIVCLTDNIFFESAKEPYEGKVAVAFVTLNRVQSSLYPKTVCEVVKQKTETVCQFSWYCNPAIREKSYIKNLTASERVVYNEIMKIAIFTYFNHKKIFDPSRGAIFYHADYVRPNWKNLIRTTTIGRHIFYTHKNYNS
jgi:spore germination cell wall hydrolase CwlJ-like protein